MSRIAARAEASAWITQLHGPNRTPELEAGFRQWLAERPENAEEFEGLTEVWDLVAHEAVSRGVPRVERWERAAGGSARWLWPVAAAIVLAVALFVFIGSDPVYSTAVGEQRVVKLDDGSRVSLNSDTRVVVSYSSGRRRVDLKRGEAYFQVAPDALRRFTVIAGSQTVTALGTSFVVRRDADQTVVTLVEGKVSVLSPPPLRGGGAGVGASSLVLTPGERITFARNVIPKRDSPRIEAVTAWRRGEVMLDDTPLSEAIAEMNRYDDTRIVLADPAIGSLIVSGLYHTGDSEGFAKSVARMYGLEMVEGEGQIELKK